MSRPDSVENYPLWTLFTNQASFSREQVVHRLSRRALRRLLSSSTYSSSRVFAPPVVGGDRVIPLREEEIIVNKQLTQVGEVRIHKRVITEQRTFAIPVRREEVTIERLPGPTVGTPNAPETLVERQPVGVVGRADAQASVQVPDENELLKDGGTIRVYVREEQVFLEKRPRIVEEIIVHKQVLEENKHIVEAVKHEEVNVEPLGNVPLHEVNLNTKTNSTSPQSFREDVECIMP